MPPQKEDLLDSIRVISDGLSAINFRLADMLPTASGFDELEHQRNEVHNRFIFLVKKFFKDSTARFISADSELTVINDRMTETLEELKDMQRVLDNVRRFVTAIDTFIGVVFPA